MKKKTIFWVMLAMVLAFGMTVVGCTTAPLIYTDNPGKEFTILGEVVYQVRIDNVANYGYTGLLKAAKSKYPDCDYIIDIMIDLKKTFSANYYVMRCTAIKYKN